MRTGLFQVNSQWENRARTRERILSILNKDESRYDCLILPEMVLSGFSMDELATTLTDDDHAFFADLATNRAATILYGGVDSRHNCVFLASPGRKPEIVYRKKHLFSYGEETKHYLPGKSNSVIEICGVRIALAICYDLRFNYQFWSEAKNCDAYVLIASWPESRREHWRTLLRARAIENQAYMIGVNRVGSDPKLNYSGDSAVYDPFGLPIIECGAQEGIFPCIVDPAETRRIRETYRFIGDRKE